MRTILFAIACVCTCACASNQNKTATVATNQVDAPPPTDFEWSWEQKVKENQQFSEAEAVRQEQKRYDESLAHIDEQLGTERLNLQACWSVYGQQSKECFSMLKHMCEVDVAVDTRGDQHRKEFCSKPFVDYHRPAKQSLDGA